MKMAKKLSAVLCIMALLISMFTGCSSKAKVKSFSKDNFSVTMDDSFEEKELIDTYYCLENPKAFLNVKKELFDDLEAVGITGDSDITDYANTVIINSELSDSEAKVSDDNSYAYFNYTKNVSGKDYYYYAVVFKSSDSFWLCQFGCIDSVKDEYNGLFVNWAKTIKIG